MVIHLARHRHGAVDRPPPARLAGRRRRGRPARRRHPRLRPAAADPAVEPVPARCWPGSSCCSPRGRCCAATTVMLDPARRRRHVLRPDPRAVPAARRRAWSSVGLAAVVVRLAPRRRADAGGRRCAAVLVERRRRRRAVAAAARRPARPTRPGNIRQLADHFGSPPEAAIGVGDGVAHRPAPPRRVDPGSAASSSAPDRFVDAASAWRGAVTLAVWVVAAVVAWRIGSRGAARPARRRRRRPAARRGLDGPHLRAAVVLPDAVGVGRHGVVLVGAVAWTALRRGGRAAGRSPVASRRGAVAARGRRRRRRRVAGLRRSPSPTPTTPRSGSARPSAPSPGRPTTPSSTASVRRPATTAVPRALERRRRHRQPRLRAARRARAARPRRRRRRVLPRPGHRPPRPARGPRPTPRSTSPPAATSTSGAPSPDAVEVATYDPRTDEQRAEYAERARPVHRAADGRGPRRAGRRSSTPTCSASPSTPACRPADQADLAPPDRARPADGRVHRPAAGRRRPGRAVTTTDGGAAGSPPPGPGGGVAWVVVACTTAVVVFATISGLASGFQPVGDNALIELRACDVFTVRPAAARDVVVGVGRRRPGPQPPRSVAVRLFAVPVRVLGGRAGIAVGAAALNIAALWGSVLVARRVGWRRRRPRHGARRGRAGVDDGQRAAVRHVAAEHPRAAVLRLPRARLGGLCGHAGALPWAVAVGSLCVQAHLSYLFLVPALPRRRRRRPVGCDCAPRCGGATGDRCCWRWRSASLAWAQPLVEQLFGARSRATSQRPGRRAATTASAAGSSLAVRMVAAVLAIPPCVVPPGLRHGDPAHAVDGPSDGRRLDLERCRRCRVAVVALLVVVAAVLGTARADPPPRRRRHTAGVARVPRRRGRRAVHGGDHADRPVIGLSPHKVRWLWAPGPSSRPARAAACRAVVAARSTRRGRAVGRRSPWGSASSCRC